MSNMKLSYENEKKKNISRVLFASIFFFPFFTFTSRNLKLINNFCLSFVTYEIFIKNDAVCCVLLDEKSLLLRQSHD